MSKTLTCLLPQIRPGNSADCMVSTHTGYTSNVTIKDDQRTYLTYSDFGGNPGALSSKAFDYPANGRNLRIEIESSTNTPLSLCEAHDLIRRTDDGSAAGFVYHFFVEDFTDNDFSDIVITVAGWGNRSS